MNQDDVILLAHARGFAQAAHINQKRKYTNEPYVFHCLAVAQMLSDLNFDRDVICAALLHDVLEDCPTITLDHLKSIFNDRIASLVLEVTDVSHPGDGNRAIRKALDRAHLAKSSHEGASIKLADLINNTESIVANDPKFALVYIPEKAALLKVLSHGHPGLFTQAQRLIEQSMQTLALTS